MGGSKVRVPPVEKIRDFWRSKSIGIPLKTLIPNAFGVYKSDEKLSLRRANKQLKVFIEAAAGAEIFWNILR